MKELLFDTKAYYLFSTTELDIYCFVGKPELAEEHLFNALFFFPFI